MAHVKAEVEEKNGAVLPRSLGYGLCFRGVSQRSGVFANRDRSEGMALRKWGVSVVVTVLFCVGRDHERQGRLARVEEHGSGSEVTGRC